MAVLQLDKKIGSASDGGGLGVCLQANTKMHILLNVPNELGKMSGFTLANLEVYDCGQF